MNGDEDLGQDIIMKGEKFHYNQQWRGHYYLRKILLNFQMENEWKGLIIKLAIDESLRSVLFI